MLAILIIKPPAADTKIQMIKKYFFGSLTTPIKRNLASFIRDVSNVNAERTINNFIFISTLVR